MTETAKKKTHTQTAGADPEISERVWGGGGGVNPIN